MIEILQILFGLVIFAVIARIAQVLADNYKSNRSGASERLGDSSAPRPVPVNAPAPPMTAAQNAYQNFGTSSIGPDREVGALVYAVLVLIVSAVLLSGCGTAASVGTTASTHTPGAAATTVTETVPRQVPIGVTTKSGAAPTPQVLAEINTVCVAVLHGWPALLRPPYGAASVSRYAAAAAPPTQRVVVSLERLEQLGDARALVALGAAWHELQALYAGAGIVVHRPSAAGPLGRQIAMREQALSTLAGTEHLPACTVRVAR